MFKKHAFQVKVVKDSDTTELPQSADFEKTVTHVTIASNAVMKEGAKYVAGIMILNAGCKILINRLSK